MHYLLELGTPIVKLILGLSLGILGIGFGLVVLGKQKLAPELIGRLVSIGRIVASVVLTLCIFFLCLPECYAAGVWIFLRIAAHFAPSGTALTSKTQADLGAYLLYTGLLDSTYVAIVGWSYCIGAFVLWLILLVVSREWVTKLVTLGAVVLAVYGIHAARSLLAIYH